MTDEEFRKRREELERGRMYELDDPGGALRRQNDREEIELLREENRRLRLAAESANQI